MHGRIRAITLLLFRLLGRVGIQLLLLLPFPVGMQLMSGLVLWMCLPAASALAVDTLIPSLPKLVLV